MHSRWIKVSATISIALTLVLIGMTSVAAQSDHSSMPPDDQESIEELRQLSGEEFEIGYINRIVPHHQGAIEMSEMVQPKIVHQQLLDDTMQIIEDQQMEIQLLTDYLNTTYSQELMPDERFMMSHDMMMQLQNASPEMAEIMYLLMMREHHQGAVVMGQIVLEKTDSLVLVNQAEQMIATQREEQERFARYLSEWYGIDAPEPTGNMQAAMEFAMSVTQTPGFPATGGGGTAGLDENGARPLLALVAALLLTTAGVGGYVMRHKLAR